MERLTDKDFNCMAEFCDAKDCVNYEDEGCCSLERYRRLKAYEDTGLTPEDINRIVDAYGRGHTLRSEHAERIGIIREISTDRLRELAQAEKDGRLHIPPVKVGDEVYWNYYDEVTGKWSIGEPEKIADVGIKGFYMSVDLDEPDTPDEFHSWDELGDEVFLTREEAEAKLVEINTEKAALERGGNHV